MLVSLFGGDGFGLIEASSGDGAYLPVFGLVAADAVVPIFPGETTLNAASTLAANGELDLICVIVAGALGAVVGDSALYWIARRSSARIEPQVERARGNPRVKSALAYKVGSTLDNYPAASIVISGAITTALMAVGFLIMRRHDRAGGGPGDPS